MKDIAKTIGQRIRSYRTERHLSQEKLAEMSGCHPTYIGQLERGEKNATIESIDKIASALGITLSRLFEMAEEHGDSPALRCYKLISQKPSEKQEQLYRILSEIDMYSI